MTVLNDLMIADDCPAIDGLFTVGSPLGVGVIQNQLKPEWKKEDGFPSSKLLGEWINIFDHFDIISRFDPTLADDYQKNRLSVVDDTSVFNETALHHYFVGYARTQRFRNQLRDMLAL